MNAWNLDLGDKLFDYDDKEMISREPVPVGKRLDMSQMRPKKRPLEAN